MRIIKSFICRMLGYHKYSYFTDSCVRCGKVRSSAANPTRK